MARYIDADELKRKLIDKGFYPAIVARALEDMPLADVVERSSFEQVSQKYLKFQQKHLNGELVEVVRCKDCIYNVANQEVDPLDSTDYSGDNIVCSFFMTDGLKNSDYCSNGERRNI